MVSSGGWSDFRSPSLFDIFPEMLSFDLKNWRTGLSGYKVLTGADEKEHGSPILTLCHGIFTDRSVFSIPFLLWKKGCSGTVTQDVKSVWSWRSQGSLIHGKFDLKIYQSMKTSWQECVEVARSYASAPGAYNGLTFGRHLCDIDS